MSAVNINIKDEPIPVPRKRSGSNGKVNGSTNSEKKEVKIKTEKVIPLMKSKLPTSTGSSLSTGSSSSKHQKANNNNNNNKSSIKPSSYNADPSTPATKIIEKASIKEVENHHRNNVIDKSSKFFLKIVDSGATDNTRRSSSNHLLGKNPLVNDSKQLSIDSSEEFADTPTRKRTKSQDFKNNSKNFEPHDQTNPKKKVKLDLFNDSSTPIISRVSKDNTDGDPIVSRTSHTPKAPVIVRSPPTFQAIDKSVVDTIPLEFESMEEIFKSVEDEKFKSQYIEISSLSYNEWVSRGFQISMKQSELVKRVIAARSELNYKFNAVFKLVNKYGESLEANDTELNNKMEQLQKLGEDIKKVHHLMIYPNRMLQTVNFF